MEIAELYDARDAYGRNWLDFQNEMTSLMAQVHSMTTGRFEAAEGRNLVDISIETMNRVVALQAAVAALGGLLAEDTADLTKEEILDTIDRAIQQAVVKVQVDVTRAWIEDPGEGQDSGGRRRASSSGGSARTMGTPGR